MKLGFYRGKYCIYWRDNAGSAVRRSLSTSDRLEAERRFLAYQGDLERRRIAGGFTIAQLWQERRDALASRRMAENMQWSGKAILPFFGHLRPDLINADLARSYADMRRGQGRKDGTILTELNHLRCVLSWARKEGLTQLNVYIPAPSRPPPKDSFLTKEQAQRFLAACQLPHIKLFTVLALTTGARTNALLEATWEQVNWSRRLLDLRSEHAVPRKGRAIVPLNETAFASLFEAKTRARSRYIVEWGGERVRSIKKGISAAAERAELEWVSPHIFRHSAAVWMAEAGISMEEIAQYLGHTDVNVTRRVYARFSPTHLRRAAFALELDP